MHAQIEQANPIHLTAADARDCHGCQDHVAVPTSAQGEIELPGSSLCASDSSPEQLRRFKKNYQSQIPRWHFPMLNDEQRNAAFENALRQVDLRGKVVLDIGSGSGLLAMMAARLGAEAVVSCEAVPPVAAMARQIVKQNGFDGKIIIVPSFSFDLDAAVHLPRPADVLVTEIVDCGLVGEGMLPTVRHARKHLLSPDAVVLPGAATITGRLLESDSIRRLNCVSSAAGFDVSQFNLFATADYFPCRLSTWPHRFLSDPFDLFSFDFRNDLLTAQQHKITVQATESGIVHGVAFWWQMAIANGVDLTNCPDNAASHWMQAVALFDSPLLVRPGQAVALVAEQDDEGVRFSY